MAYIVKKDKKQEDEQKRYRERVSNLVDMIWRMDVDKLMRLNRSIQRKV